jgi:UDP-2,4-diacetamido-2,4,6-trideoxy-beta-L-altropyranose hydrolase
MIATALFRADASSDIGTGHIMRCLTLADALRRSDISSVFMSRNFDGNLCELIADRGFEIQRLPKPKGKLEGTSAAHESTEIPTIPRPSWEIDAIECTEKLKNRPDRIDLLVVDHYSLDGRWERYLRPYASRLMVIDDLANRPHDCDVILDQNYYKDLGTRYDKLVPPACQLLLGPKYALLREEFFQARSRAYVRNGRIRRILIFLGGGDPENITSRVLAALSVLDISGVVLDVVVGASNPHRAAIKDICSRIPLANYHCQVTNMSALMLGADLAIGAGGTTTWERCALGLPTLTIVIAENQLQTTQDMSDLGVIWYMGRSTELDHEALRVAIHTALNAPDRLRDMSAKSIEFMSQLPNESASATTAYLLKEIKNAH